MVNKTPKNPNNYLLSIYRSFWANHTDTWGKDYPDWFRPHGRDGYRVFGSGNIQSGYASEQALYDKLEGKKMVADHYLSPQFASGVPLHFYDKYLCPQSKNPRGNNGDRDNFDNFCEYMNCLRVVTRVTRKENKEFLYNYLRQRIDSSVKIDVVIQETTNLPFGMTTHPKREKPWGTAHAVWCAKDFISDDFAIINADDYYGAKAFKNAANFFNSSRLFFKSLKSSFEASIDCDAPCANDGGNE